MLQHVKRATFSRFIRKIVNIYWLILVVVGVVGWFLFWLLFKSSHCVDWFFLSLFDPFVVMIGYFFVVVQILQLLFCVSKFKYLLNLAPMCVAWLFLGRSSVPFVIWLLLLLLVSLVLLHTSSMQVWEWTTWIHHWVIFSSMIFKLCLLYCVILWMFIFPFILMKYFCIISFNISLSLNVATF